MVSERADVVVVGGGILGCSAAFHLAEAGVGDVLLLERDVLGEGTTAAGAGFLTQWGSRPADLSVAQITWGSEKASQLKTARGALDAYALDFYGGLAASGHEIGYRNNGMIWMATDEETWNEHLAEMAASLPPPNEVIDGDQVKALADIVDAAGVYKAIFQPGAAQITAPLACRTIGDRARKAGARIQTRRPITGLRTTGGRVTGVETPWGAINADAVVLATGAWTNELLAATGSFLPMMPFTVARIVTEPIDIPPTLPLLMLPESRGLWVREWGGGLLYGNDFAAAPRYAFSKGPVPNRFDQLPIDGVLQMQRYGAEASRVLPVLAQDHSMTPAHGVPCLTPDGVGLIGPLTGLDGAWVVGGCNALGISYGPGYGRVLADLLVNGSSDLLDASLLSPARFSDRYASLDEAVDDTKQLHASRRGHDAATVTTQA